MRIRTSYITTLLAAGAAAVAIAVAPMATAAPTPMQQQQQSCSATGGGTECQSPGNVEIQNSPPPVSFEPYGGYGPALGIL